MLILPIRQILLIAVLCASFFLGSFSEPNNPNHHIRSNLRQSAPSYLKVLQIWNVYVDYNFTIVSLVNCSLVNDVH